MEPNIVPKTKYGTMQNSKLLFHFNRSIVT